MDISTGRCPSKQKNCSCKKVCLERYGVEVRRLRQEALAPNKDEVVKEQKMKEWQNFVRKHIKSF